MAKVPRKKILGVALDIGTTDIKGALLDISSKKELAAASVPNEQKAFGPDVITRLGLATKEGGLKELNKKAISAINKLLTQLAGDASVDKRDIKDIIAAGNSTMYHLVLMIDPSSLARAPFLPAKKDFQERNANEMGLDVAEDALFTFLPNISGFVGSDILAAILVSGMHRDKKHNLIVDMGTNGEIALGSEEKIFIASCASGPAFEGRHISCGMPAIGGAIVGAKLEGKEPAFNIVGNGAAKGISGSGLVDIISILLDKGEIERTGKMKHEEFTLSEKSGKKIYVTQKDVRQVQLAKAALSAGIEILREKAKIDLNALDHFYITGAFGEGIGRESAKNIGLIPKEIPLDKITFLKNGALSGAKEVLLTPSRRRELNNILSKCEHVELHRSEDFQNAFASSLHF
jgi:uncharacterized 2Fe-2S/4Fe-4S cluster protein (DUF4445 family)